MAELDDMILRLDMAYKAQQISLEALVIAVQRLKTVVDGHEQLLATLETYRRDDINN